MPPLPSKRILVVDDEPFVSEAIKMMLSHDGHQVETASSGEEALTKFDPARCDVVFTDFSMPGMKGDQLANAIKARSPKTPVIMLTAFPPSQKPRGIELILTKPFLLQSLRDGLIQVFSAQDGE
jgi:CheY-like chemotaxis protein